MGRAPCCDKANVKKGPWSPEEDAKLKSYIEQHGTGGNWIALPQKIGLRRCGKSCRLRWLNYLRPNIKHGGFTEEEDRMICSLYVSIGSRWSIIAAQLPGRTDNDIKNYWNTKLKKKLFGQQHKQLKARRSSSFKQASVLKSENIVPEYTNNNNTYCPEFPLNFSNQIPSYSEQTCFSGMLDNLEGTRRESNAEKQIDHEETYLQYPADHTSLSQQLCQQSLTNISSPPTNVLNEIRGPEDMHTDYYMNGTNFTNLLVQNGFPGDNVDAILYSIPERTRAPGQLFEDDCPRSGASYGETISLIEILPIVNTPLASNCGATQVSSFNDITHPGVQ